MSNPTLGEFCFAAIGRVDIEGSKSDVVMNVWPPRASYLCGNLSDTSSLKTIDTTTKGSMATLSQSIFELKIIDRVNVCPITLREVSVLFELTPGHLRYSLAGVPAGPIFYYGQHVVVAPGPEKHCGHRAGS